MNAAPVWWRVLRLCLASLALLIPRVASAHAIHTTLTVVTGDATGITMMIRVFADDFSSSVARFAGRPAPADSAAPAADVARYVASRVTLRGPSGALVLQPCGIRRAAELYWVCVRVPARALTGLTLHNGLLTELHGDQINIVQIQTAGQRRTLLYTRTTAALSLDARA